MTATAPMVDKEWAGVESSFLLNELARMSYHRQMDRRAAAHHHDQTSSSSSRPTTAGGTANVSVTIHGNNDQGNRDNNTNSDAGARLEQQKRALREQWRTIHEDRILTRLHRARAIQPSWTTPSSTSDDPHSSTSYELADLFYQGRTLMTDDRTGTATIFNESLRYITQALRNPALNDEPSLQVTSRHHNLLNMVHDSQSHRRDPFSAIIKSVEEQRRDWAAVQAAMAARVASVTFMADPSLPSSSSSASSSRVVWAGLEDGTTSNDNRGTGHGQRRGSSMGSYGRISELKRQHAASTIQRTVRQWLRRRHARWFRQRQIRLRDHLRRQLEKRAYIDAVQTLQSYIHVWLAHQSMRRHRLEQLRRYHTAKRIWRWYRYHRAMRRSYTRWQSRGVTRLNNEWRWWVTHVRDVITVQSAVRRWAANRVADRRTILQSIHDEHRIEREWQLERAQLAAVADIEHELVHGSIMAAQEMARVEKEITGESVKFEKKWKKWERSLRDHFFQSKPLPKFWLPQMDRRTGSVYYINLTTGETQHHHPFTAEMEAVRSQERTKGESQLQERLARLVDYKQRIQVGEEQSRNRLLTQWNERATACYQRNLHLLAVHPSTFAASSASTSSVSTMSKNGTTRMRRLPATTNTMTSPPPGPRASKNSGNSNRATSSVPVPVPSTLIMGSRIPATPTTAAVSAVVGRPILSMGMRFPSSSMIPSSSPSSSSSSSSSSTATNARRPPQLQHPQPSFRHVSAAAPLSPDSPTRPGQSYAI